MSSQYSRPSGVAFQSKAWANTHIYLLILTNEPYSPHFLVATKYIANHIGTDANEDDDVKDYFGYHSSMF